VAAAEFGAEGAGAGRLPRGRHGLPREVIVENQRQRLIVATVAAVAEHGYNATTVSSIVKSAGLSRATFYELFKGKEACFLAAYEATLANLREATLAGAEKAEDWAERIRAGLGSACHHRRLAEQRTKGRHRLSLDCRPRPESGDGCKTQGYSQSRTDPKLAHQPASKFASRKPHSQAVCGPSDQAL
jgi:AcrR family transcriptional regulator